ncbi:MAG: hypothetical protein ABJP87_07960, partial [Bauldia litoralis]
LRRDEGFEFRRGHVGDKESTGRGPRNRHEHATCVAAPITDHAGRCVACICFIVSAATSEQRMRELSAVLVESARKISASPG